MMCVSIERAPRGWGHPWPFLPVCPRPGCGACKPAPPSVCIPSDPPLPCVCQQTARCHRAVPIPAVLLLLPAATCLRPALAVFGRSIARARDLPGVIETSSLLEADFAERKRMGQLVDDRAVVEVVLEKMMDDKYMCVAASLPPPR